MAQSRGVRRFICEFCKLEFSNEATLSLHIASKCPKLFNITRQCPYCSKEYTSKSLSRHLTNCHPDKDPVRFYPLPDREVTKQDAILREKLQEVGHPGGTTEPRDGYIQCFNGKFRVSHYVYEYFGEPVPKPTSTRKSEAWIGDALLPLDQIMIHHFFECPIDWNLGHHAQWSMHQGTEKEKLANRLGSNCCYQHVRVNRLIAKLEGLIEGFPNNYFTHVFSGTKVGKDPKMWGKKEKKEKKGKDGKEKKSKILKAAVPDFILKIIILQCKKTMEWLYDAFVVPNDAICGKECAAYRQPIDYINKLTGFKYINTIKEKCKRVNILEDVIVTKQERPKKRDHRVMITDPTPSTSISTTPPSSTSVELESLQKKYEILEKENNSLKMKVLSLKKKNEKNKRVIAELEERNKKRRVIEEEED